MKSFEQPSEIKSGNEWLRLHNKMQIALVKKYFGFEPENEQLNKWFGKYSAAFRKLVQEHPELLDKFGNNPEAAITRAEEILYGAEQKEAERFSQR